VLSIPGCIGAIPLDKTSFSIEVVPKLNLLAMSTCFYLIIELRQEGDFSAGAPLLYYFGNTSPKDNVDLFKHMASNLAEKVNARQDCDAASKSSGIIVTSTGWIDAGGIDLLTHIIRVWQIDVVLVNGHDRLYSSLQSESIAMSAAGQGELTVIKLMRSGGAVQRSDSDRRRLRKAKIHDYFYGTRRSDASGAGLGGDSDGLSLFSPSRIDLQLHRYTLLRCGDEKLSQSMVPLGGQATAVAAPALRLAPAVASMEMEHCLLGVLYAPTSQKQQDGDVDDLDMGVALLNCNVAGFVYVVKVDLDMNVLTVLAPSSGPLPGTNLIVGLVKWVE
jgi:polyribonucleotide 5'-hydroxyl-kinase